MSSLINFTGQGWLQLAELTLAFVLSALVGLEREIRQKSAGLRTHTLVGVAAALIMLISKYGFMDVLQSSRIVLDPSRVAAQIVSGIGFIGGGVIFMRRDVVRGLTTAASVWLTAALGMACGAGLPILAIATTIGHFVIMLVFPRLVHRLPRPRRTTTTLCIRYESHHELLAPILSQCSEMKFAIDQFQIDRNDQAILSREEAEDLADQERIDITPPARHGLTALRMQVKGKRPVSDLIATLSGLDGIREVGTLDGDNGLD
ncbi:MAG TPA: MgtC/SapB family protein [Rhodopila sp.]|nr:MgtC/SapB family protein [Rhodopila sp.]